MIRIKILLVFLLILAGVLYLRMLRRRGLAESTRIARLRYHLGPPLQETLKKQGFTHNAPALLRVFRQEQELEVWLREGIGGRYALFRTLTITAESPEVADGVYLLEARHLRDTSKHGLIMDTGFPNAVDKAAARHGQLWLHASTADGLTLSTEQMEILYLLAEQALRGRDRVLPLYILPFRMSDRRLECEKNHPRHALWTSLRQGSAYFDQEKLPPLDGARDGLYVFRAQKL